MSALVLKMTTAASHPIIHTTKKPYNYPPNLFFPNWVWPRSSRFALNSNNNNNNAIEAITTQTHRHKYGWWRIAPCAPPAHKATNYSLLPPPPPPLLLHHHHHHHQRQHQNLGPRFRGPHKCLSISSSSSSSLPNSGRSENEGELPGSAEPGAGLMADMGSEDQSHSNNHEWFDSQFYPDKDELLSPMQNHHQPPPHQSPKLLTLPTILTLGRVAAVPLLITTFYVDSWWGKTATTSIFIAAAITDWLDGYLARKMRLGSAFGAFLDPVADKLMVAATLVLLCSRPNDVTAFGQVPWLLVVPSIAIIGREITMSAVREWAASQNTKLLEAVAVNNLGKWKTATQMIALTILLATRDSSLGGPEFVVASGVVLLYISAGLAVWSLVVYMSKIWKVLLR